jgi:predicted dehydrogenase
MVSYRSGDMVSPALVEAEALQNAVAEFASAIRGHRAPLTDGLAGLRVLRLLAAASRSLAAGGVLVTPGDPLRW